MCTRLILLPQKRFPHKDKEPERYAKQMDKLFTLVWEDEKGTFAIGYILRSVFDELKKVPHSIRGDIQFDPYKRTVLLFRAPTEQKRSELAAATAHYLRANQTFKLLKGWRNEMWPIYGRNGELILSMERAAMGLYGTLRYGVHLIAYIRSPSDPYGIKIWVPKRSTAKTSFAGMFDNTVAGGLMTDEDPFECVIREADEEASLPEHVVRENAKLVDFVRYIYITDTRSGEKGYIYPECQWVYDLELPRDVIPEPNDDEVEEFSLLTVDEVKEFLAQGRFKPNCAVVTLGFFIRHGIITRENEPDFDAIGAGLYRKMPFPGLQDEDE